MTTDNLIELERSHSTAERTFVRVTFEGEQLLTSADPEHDACRALLARGITGTLVTRWKGAAHDAMRLDIERAAGFRTVDARKDGPRTAPWRPFGGIDGDVTEPAPATCICRCDGTAKTGARVVGGCDDTGQLRLPAHGQTVAAGGERLTAPAE